MWAPCGLMLFNMIPYGRENFLILIALCPLQGGGIKNFDRILYKVPSLAQVSLRGWPMIGAVSVSKQQTVHCGQGVYKMQTEGKMQTGHSAAYRSILIMCDCQVLLSVKREFTKFLPLFYPLCFNPSPLSAMQNFRVLH